MEGVKRNLVYWGRVLEKTTFSMFVGVAAYMLFMSVLEGEFNLEKIGGNVLAFLALFVCITTFAMAFQALQTYFPLTLSMGSTRKASFIGMQIMLHLILLQWCMLGVGIAGFMETAVKEVVLGMAPGIMGGIVFLMMLANLMCVFAVCFGKKVGFATYILLIVGMIVGVSFSVTDGSFDNSGAANLEWFSRPYLLLIGIAADAIVIFAYYKAILKYNY